MKKLTDRIERNPFLSVFVNREIFTLTYLTVCVLLSLPSLLSVMGVAAKVCFVWGVGLIGWDLITKRRLFRMSCWAMPLLILGAYAVTVLLNREVAVTGLKHWLHLAISLLLMYTQDRDAEEKRLMKTAKRGFVVINLLTFCTGVASLVMFALQTQVMLKIDGVRYKQGFYENRLYGVYVSPNPGALLAIVSVIGVVFLFLFKDGKKLKCRWFFIANAAVQLVYYSLTLSKGGALSAAAAGAVIFAFVFVPRFARNRSVVKTAVLSVLIFVLAAGALEGVVCGVRAGMSYVPGIVEISQKEGTGKKTGKKRVTIERVEQEETATNGRVNIWKGGLKLFRSAPLFGVADADVDKVTGPERFDFSGFDKSEKLLLYSHNGYFHNVAVQIMVYSGGVGLLLFASFAALIVWKLLRVLLFARKDTPRYRAVAVLTALSAALGVNGVSEAHLVYHRQDPIGLMFWLFLGIAVVLAEQYRKSPEGALNGTEDRFALMASTPYQVLNCLAFAQNGAEGSRGHTDLYLAHPFSGSEELSARLRRCGVFNNVYDLDAFEKYDSLKGKLTTFYRLFLPEPALKTMARGKLPVKGYSFVGASSQTSASIALRRTYPEADVLLYDDGIGSYYGSMVRDYNSPLFRLLNAVFFCGGLNLDPVKQFLTNPAMSQNETDAPVFPLPAATEECIAAAKEVFGYIPNDDYRGKAVYLTQPLEEWPEYSKENEEEIIRLVGETFGGRAVGRVHPRQQLASLGGINISGTQNLWELECVSQITDDTILIGGFSTAQLTPKMLCDKEPTVVFTYRLLVPGATGGQAEKICRLIGSYKAACRDPDRVLFPETMEEFARILREL